MKPALSAVLLRSQDDLRLVGLAAHGSQQAFAVLSQRYRNELLAHARRLVAADRAEDVVQQGLLSAWAALRRGADVHDARAWLHQIVRHEAFRVLHTVPEHAELVDSLPGSAGAGEEAELRLDARDALAALAALPEQQRRALQLTALDGRSGREAAATLGLREGALRQLVHRARATVRAGVGVLVPVPLVNWAATVADSPATAVPAGAGIAVAVGKLCTALAVTAVVVGGGVKVLSGAHSDRDAALAHGGQPGAARVVLRRSLAHSPSLTASAGHRIGEPAATTRATPTALVLPRSPAHPAVMDSLAVHSPPEGEKEAVPVVDDSVAAPPIVSADNGPTANDRNASTGDTASTDGSASGDSAPPVGAPSASIPVTVSSNSGDSSQGDASGSSQGDGGAAPQPSASASSDQ